MLHRATVAAAVVVAVVVAGAAPGTRAQSPQTPPVFRTGVDVVQLDVSVLDENRQPVPGLTAADFTVVERGQPQPIVSFAAVNLPGRPVGGAPWLLEVAPDVTTNHQDAQRVIVILMDDCNAPFDPMVAKFATRIARETIDFLGPADLAAVVYTASRRQGQEFTSDRARLRAAVDRFAPRGGSPTPHPFSASRTSSGALPLGFGSGSGPCAGAQRSVEQAMKNTAEILRDYPGWRKTLVFISPFTPVFDATSMETVTDLSDWAVVFDAMQEANLTVYQFDPRGLEVGADITRDLGAFADATGGRTMQHTNAPEAGIPQMFRENSSYYMLGIQPVDPARNGRFRAIDVRVNRPGVTVRARAGYFAPKDVKPPKPSNRPLPSAAERAIAGALPSGDLPMSLMVVPMAGERPRSTTVTVIAGFTPLGLPADGEDVDVRVSAFRDDWKQMGTATQTVRVSMPRAEAGPPHVDIPVSLELPPGRYEIRAAINRPQAAEIGSAYASVVVPDFAREDLALSGVLIQRRTAGRAAVGSGDPAPGTTVRTFDSADSVSATLSTHQGGRQPALPVEVEMRIVDGDNRTRIARRVSLTPAQFSGARAAELQFDLPLVGLESGEYLVSFSASSARGSALRQLRLTLR